MRTLKLSNKEIETILRALGIAENQINKTRGEYISNFINVRGISNKGDILVESDVFLKLENEFGDLLNTIKKSEKDV